ncbi:MAG: hypothetical protein ACXW1Q_06530 [Halobacteriota archaeon]
MYLLFYLTFKPVVLWLRSLLSSLILVSSFLLPADNPKWAVAFYESWTITKWEWSLVDRDFVAVNLQADQCLADLFPALRCEEALKVREKIRKLG